MPQITYVEHNGTEHTVDVPAGNSVMQGAMDNLIEGIVAECGGACSCATCHVKVEEAWTDKTGTASEIEEQMLECAIDAGSTSRLSCQITVTDELNGLVVHIPESQY